MISKELLSDVFGVDIKDDPEIGFAYDDYNGVELEWKEVRFNFISYPLDYVANKCKEWALIRNRGLEIIIYQEAVIVRVTMLGVYGNGNIMHFENDKTEPEAIFKACQWILDNK